jgi:23S rRNA (pseudouridine1915-N3)-methyltransferase
LILALADLLKSIPKLKLIAIGKVKKGWIREGLEVYLKRVPELEVVELKDSSPAKEGELVLSMLRPEQQLVALTETGQTFSSVQLAQFLGAASSHQLVFFIGSADGLSVQVQQQAAHRLSLSPMTFPHELARLLLVEQLYRAKTILQGGQYHK